MTGPPRTVRVLPRGNWLDDSGEVVQPGIPDFLAPLDKKERATRIDLAKWVVVAGQPADGPRLRQSPVEGRVRPGPRAQPRRLRHAGHAADAPGAARLAGHRVRPHRLGRRRDAQADGDVERLPAVVAPSREGVRERDPSNVWLARQNRFRLDAEFVRDNALAVGGLLTTKVGGPSVKPYQPAGLLGAT